MICGEGNSSLIGKFLSIDASKEIIKLFVILYKEIDSLYQIDFDKM